MSRKRSGKPSRDRDRNNQVKRDEKPFKKQYGKPFVKKTAPVFKGTLLPLIPKTRSQEDFIDSIHENEITICDAVAGTGKSHIAFGSAIHYRESDHRIKRIIIVRPTVSAGDGDDLGFLPGTLEMKMSPYLMPLFKDILPSLVECDSYLSPVEYQSFMENYLIGLNIEVVPFQFMRGRTFDNAFVILDEAQNASKADFKLFLTRLGKCSKCVIEGDSSQSDIKDNYFSELQGKLTEIDGVGIVTMDDAGDIIRNPLISTLLRRLED